MTNQEAISVLESINAKTDYYLINDDARAEAVDMAISALQEQEVKNSSDLISRQALCEYALNQKDKSVTPNDIMRFPSAQPEWNNHTVACLLAELFDDTCACNYNGIDEWLPEKCELMDSCPNPVGVACWEQFLKHRAERRNDEHDT